MTKRLSQDDYLWRLAFQVAARSTCNREHHGCVIARDGRVLSTGYNGSVAGEKHCDEAGHELVQVSKVEEHDMGTFVGLTGTGGPSEIHCVRTLHAEQNAILNAAAVGLAIESADWYITGISCQVCAKMISQLKPNRLFLCGDRGHTGANHPRTKQYCQAVSFANLKMAGVVPGDFKGDHDA